MTGPERETGAAEHGREIALVARLAPGRRAIASEHGDLTFAELDRSAERLAGYLQNAGLAAGDVVALLCTNRPEWIVTQQAALRSGLRLVPVNWHLKGDDIAYVIADSGAQALITEDTFVSEPSVSELSDETRGHQDPHRHWAIMSRVSRASLRPYPNHCPQIPNVFADP